MTELIRRVPDSWSRELLSVAKAARINYLQERPPHDEEYAQQVAAWAVARRVIQLIERDGLPPQVETQYTVASDKPWPKEPEAPPVILLDGRFTQAQRIALADVIETIRSRGGNVDRVVAASLQHFVEAFRPAVEVGRVQLVPEERSSSWRWIPLFFACLAVSAAVAAGAWWLRSGGYAP